MNRISLSLLFLGGVVACSQLSAQTESSAAATGSKNPMFEMLGPEYRKVVIVPETYISPFRRPEARAAQLAAQNEAAPEGPNKAKVIERIKQLGLTGVIAGSGPRPGSVIIGNGIYIEGAEIELNRSDFRGQEPILNGYKVKVRSVDTKTVMVEAILLANPSEPALVALQLDDILNP